MAVVSKERRMMHAMMAEVVMAVERTAAVCRVVAMGDVQKVCV